MGTRDFLRGKQEDGGGEKMSDILEFPVTRHKDELPLAVLETRLKDRVNSLSASFWHRACDLGVEGDLTHPVMQMKRDVGKLEREIRENKTIEGLTEIEKKFVQFWKEYHGLGKDKVR